MKKDALLLGVVHGDQKVAMLNAPLKVDQDFMHAALEIGHPEKRFRFAHKCVEGACAQWNGKQCGVIHSIALLNEHLNSEENNLPQCIIRKTCRWFHQEGSKACTICPYVVTDQMEI